MSDPDDRAKCKRVIRPVFLREDDSDRLTFSTRESESPSWLVASVCFSLFLSVFGRENESCSAVSWWICTKPRNQPLAQKEGVECECSPRDCVCIKMNSLRKWLYKPKVLQSRIFSTNQDLFLMWPFLFHFPIETWYIFAGPVLLCRWGA